MINKIEIHKNGKVTDLDPANMEEAQELSKKLIETVDDTVDIYTVEKQHIMTIKKGYE